MDLREELAVGSEQLIQVADEADDARIRALVSEAPMDDRTRRESARVSEKLERHLAKVRSHIATLEAQQDDLLDRLSAERSSS